jgi:hypothetical protein
MPRQNDIVMTGIFLKVPNYNYYVGRQDNGKTLGRALPQQALIDRLSSELVRPDINFSQSFKENLACLKRQVERRGDMLKNIA